MGIIQNINVSIGRSIATSLLILFSLLTFAQANKPDVLLEEIDSVNLHKVYIDNIFITGNKRTRDRIILRELSFYKGETYSIEVLRDMLEADRNKIYNTKLFNTVEVGLLELDLDKVDVVVKVEERWYLFPIPLIDIIDRNFNDWWVNHNHDFSRIIYGLSLYHFNMRGMNERMTLTAQFGYSNRYEIEYEFPYIDRTQQNGLSLFAKYIEYTNLHYDNIDNKRIFLDSKDILKTNVYTGVGYTRRNSFYTRHHFDLRYSYTSVADTIVTINPNYLGIEGNTQNYFSATYTFNHDKRDIVAYPLEGYKLQASIEKLGIGIFDDVDVLSLRAHYSKYKKLPNKFFLSNYTSAYFSTPNNQPYSVLRGIGFRSDVVRGYELYVIHGQHYFVNKTTFKRELISGTKKLENFPLEQFQHFPYALYLKTYFDFGYASNTESYEGNKYLADKIIYGGGIGLDIVTMYDVVIRLEYSINSQAEHGFFFHIESEF